MEAFTKEGIARREAERDESVQFDIKDMHPPWYYEYELAGIVVHQGSADFGHYYSYIKVRLVSKKKSATNTFVQTNTHC